MNLVYSADQAEEGVEDGGGVGGAAGDVEVHRDVGRDAGAFLVAGQPALALGIPAGVLIIVGLGMDFADRRTPFVLIGAVALVVVAAILGGR